MSPCKCARDLKADLRRHLGGEGHHVTYKNLLGLQGVWATVVFRFGQWVYDPSHIKPVEVPLKAIYKTLQKSIEITTGISVPATADIGPGLYVGHFGQIFLDPNLKAGKNLSVGQGVTIGARGVGHRGAPVLGDDVYVGVGAKILGNVHIGDGVHIGANAVVVHDVPDNTTVVGIPARPIRRSRTEESPD